MTVLLCFHYNSCLAALQHAPPERISPQSETERLEYFGQLVDGLLRLRNLVALSVAVRQELVLVTVAPVLHHVDAVVADEPLADLSVDARHEWQKVELRRHLAVLEREVNLVAESHYALFPFR